MATPEPNAVPPGDCDTLLAFTLFLVREEEGYLIVSTHANPSFRSAQRTLPRILLRSIVIEVVSPGKNSPAKVSFQMPRYLAAANQLPVQE